MEIQQTPNPPIEKQVLNSAELMQFLGIGEKGLYSLIKEKRIRSHKLGSRNYRFLLNEILEDLRKL